MNERQHYRMDDLKNAFASAPCGIGIFAVQTHQPLFLNAAYYRLVGYTPEEYHALISNQDQKLFLPEDLSVNQRLLQKYAREGKLSGVRYRIVQKSGGVCWVNLCVTSTITVDEKDCALCFFENITAEQENFAQMKLVAESIGSSICVLRIKNERESLLYANETFFRLLNVDRDKYLENLHALNDAFASAQDRERIRQAIVESIRTGVPQELTYRFLRPHAGPIWMNRRLAAIRQDEADTYLLVSISTDVTEKKEKELALAIEQRRYQLVVDEMKAAVFEWDLKTGLFYCSDNYLRQLQGLRHEHGGARAAACQSGAGGRHPPGRQRSHAAVF